MADVIKTIEGKLVKINSELQKKQKLLMEAIERTTELQKTSLQIEEFVQECYSGETLTNEKKSQKLFGKNVKKADAVKLDAKFKADLKKQVAAEGQLKVEFSSLTRQKEVAEKTLATYQDEKKNLKASLKDNVIDKKEYERRKQLIKTSLADITTVSEKQLSGLKKTQKEKESKLIKLIPEVEKKTIAWSDANEFVAKDFKPEDKDFPQKCQKIFGKKTLSKPDALKAVKKLKDELDKTNKDHEKLSAELAAVGMQIDEIEKRLKEIARDIERDRKAFEEGGITEKEFNLKVTQWKKSVALG
jgi:predicted transcriptional regulator